MPFVDLGQYKFHYLEFGEENKNNGTILFLHAFTLDHRMWIAEAEYFSKEYHVIVPDLKGHGLSDAPQSGYSRYDRVEDLNNFLLKLKLPPVHLVGLSYGGTTGIGLALTYPARLASLSLVGSSAAGYNLGPKISRIDDIARSRGIDAAKKRWMSSSLSWYKEDRQEMKQFVKTMMEEHSGAIWADPKRGNYPPENDLGRIHTICIPTKIIVGELDRIFLPLAKEIADKIKGSDLSILPETGHLVNLEAPAEFQSCLKSFLSKLKR